MPRLTNTTYLQAHHYLSTCWLHDRSLYANLSRTEQWQLHAYFQPSKDLTPEQLLAHRQAANWHDPALPQQAGRAYAMFQKTAAAHAAHVKAAQPVVDGGRFRGQHHVTVTGAVARPEPDVRRYVKAVLRMAELDHQTATKRRTPPAA